jgi:ornithine cyclodeaminase/alanine dehydrogenase
MQLWGITIVREIEKAVVFDPNQKAATLFVKEMGKMLNLEIVNAQSPEELLDTDIICTATSSATPIFDGNQVKKGTHINGIGSHTPNARELDTTIVKRSKFIGDSKEACFNEAGDIMIPLQEGSIDESHFHADLGEIVTGKKDRRTSDTEITIFKSNGLAIQDTATAKLIYEKAKQNNIGVDVEI